MVVSTAQNVDPNIPIASKNTLRTMTKASGYKKKKKWQKTEKDSSADKHVIDSAT